ncbi:DUF1801 domain-containing protein [Niveispirillum sp.]|uniref:DUF1801 domain-containing protein n=1 Tax=Niveispirillum sp. TaxID=1917217 RepID=UPI001B691F9E|nr:DUF1801 domain-containing protein [Niveispirillum sp.]MBP7335526.1 DUF1801 domain-containing protein [Niveispirillum sp.]
MPPKSYKDVEAFLDDLSPQARQVAHGLRALIRAVHPGLTEQVKWNAPSFALDGQDLLTLGVQRDGTIRLVLHRGAKVKDNDGFHVDDPLKLAQWPAPDRGVVIVRDAAALAAMEVGLTDLVRRWVGA